MEDISKITLPDGSTYNLKDSTARTVVKQTAKSDNKEYKILTTSSDSPTSGNAAEAAYDTDITLNPSTNTITATNFAGNASTATSAGKLQNTSKVGDTNKPVYFTANGVPAEISYTVDKSVPSTAVFTDTTYTFADGVAGNFTVTPSGGSAQTISIGKPAAAETADSAKKLASVHTVPVGVEGFYKFLEIPMQYVAQQTMVLAIDSELSSSCGLLRIHTRRISSAEFQEIGWVASGKTHQAVRWNYSDNKWNLYLAKSFLDKISFHIISATSDNSYTWKLDSVTAEDFLAATEADEYVDLQAASAVEDANGDQIDTTYLKKTETAHSSYTLFPTKVYPGSLAAGWYKFAEVNITDTTGKEKITFKYGLSSANYDFIGEIFVYKTNSTTMNCTMQIPYSVSGKITYFRYNIDSANTVSFYVYKHDAYGNPVFTFITSEDINGNYLDPSTYMLDSLVAETPPATALKPIYSAINRWVYNVPVSPGTNQQILSYSLGMITSASVLAKIEFANPEYIKSDCSWETTDGTNPNDNGTITLTGTCTAATTANLLILNVLPD